MQAKQMQPNRLMMQKREKTIFLNMNSFDLDDILDFQLTKDVPQITNNIIITMTLVRLQVVLVSIAFIDTDNSQILRRRLVESIDFEHYR